MNLKINNSKIQNNNLLKFNKIQMIKNMKNVNKN